jgi:hypothetical protein
VRVFDFQGDSEVALHIFERYDVLAMKLLNKRLKRLLEGRVFVLISGQRTNNGALWLGFVKQLKLIVFDVLLTLEFRHLAPQNRAAPNFEEFV